MIIFHWKPIKYFLIQKQSKFKIINIFLLVLSIIFLQACSFFSDPNQLSIKYSSSTDLNPDINAQASPLVVTMYQLKSSDNFQTSDYFPLVDNAKDILGNNLIAQDQIEIRPNQTIEIKKILSKETKFIAFVASYRDIDNASWKNIMPLTSIKHKKLSVQLDSETLKLKS